MPRNGCVVCLEKITNFHDFDRKYCICRTCIRQVFTTATNDETHYPARLGPSQLLSLGHYRRYLTNDIAKAYEDKALEYGTHPKNRVYCTCEACGLNIASSPGYCFHSHKRKGRILSRAVTPFLRSSLFFSCYSLSSHSLRTLALTLPCRSLDTLYN